MLAAIWVGQAMSGNAPLHISVSHGIQNVIDANNTKFLSSIYDIAGAAKAFKSLAWVFYNIIGYMMYGGTFRNSHEYVNNPIGDKHGSHV